jgi:hypothetical protein
MENFLKRYIVILFVALMSHQVARADEGRGNPEGPAGGEATERRTANHPEERAARRATRSRGRQLGGTHGPGGGCNGWSVRATGGPRRAHCRSASRQDRATGDHRLIMSAHSSTTKDCPNAVRMLSKST